METWRLLAQSRAPAGFNMGLDEALLDRTGTPPTLRLYGWDPAALSIGYFQRVADVRGIDRARAVVRRITGGGAIHHADELTFSIAVPREHALYRGAVSESYVRVHGVIVTALARLGIDAGLRGDAELASDVAGTGMCFHASTPLDIVWGGRKGVGSAQRRRAGRILHHGSIKLGATELEEEIATVGRSAEEVGGVLVRAFEEVLGIELRRGEATEAETHAADERGVRYSSPEFVGRR